MMRLKFLILPVDNSRDINRLHICFCRHNCDDEKCYYDLARLRGVHYMTWTNSTAIEQEDEVSQVLHTYIIYINTSVTFTNSICLISCLAVTAGEWSMC